MKVTFCMGALPCLGLGYRGRVVAMRGLHIKKHRTGSATASLGNGTGVKAHLLLVTLTIVRHPQVRLEVHYCPFAIAFVGKGEVDYAIEHCSVVKAKGERDLST